MRSEREIWYYSYRVIIMDWPYSLVPSHFEAFLQVNQKNFMNEQVVTLQKIALEKLYTVTP